MSTNETPTPNHLVIDERKDAQRRVVVRPASDDLFVRTGKQVIEGCRLSISLEIWLEEVTTMLQEVCRWSEQRAGRIRACYAVPSGTKICLFFVPVTEQFDFDLADELANFNTDLVSRFNVGMVETRQIPWSEWDRFLDPRSVREVYGESLPAHPAVEA